MIITKLFVIFEWQPCHSSTEGYVFTILIIPLNCKLGLGVQATLNVNRCVELMVLLFIQLDLLIPSGSKHLTGGKGEKAPI